MRVLKFGGASVKDAEGVRNLKKVLDKIGYKNTILVISAMGKMTNAFENIVNSYFYQKEELNSNIEVVVEFHKNIRL